MTRTQLGTDCSHEGIRALDAAKGILVALRRYTLADAFAEIVDVAAKYHIGTLSVCSALVDLAEGRSPAEHSPIVEAVRQEWAMLVETSARMANR